MNERLLSGGKFRMSDLVAILIILFPIFNLSSSNITSYYDEIIGLISVVIVFFLLFNGNVEKGSYIFIIYFLSTVTLLGLISNLVSQVSVNFIGVSVDVLWLWKTFATFLLFRYIASNQLTGYRIKAKLLPIAKLTIVFVFVVAVIGEFFDIGVTGSYILGPIKAFGFFWRNGIQTGWLMFCCILIISSLEKPRVFYKYLIIATVPLLMTGSSLVICWLVIEYILLILLRGEHKIKPSQIVLLAVTVVAAVFSEIRTYFLEGGVRGTLLKNGVKLANEYFPLGTGFATYGSEMAMRYYSPIYVELGWRNSYAYGTTSTYMNDNFFASIIGQFGWLGFAFYLGCLVVLFLQVNTKNLGKYERVSAIATVLTICAVMIGSGSAKSMMGVCTFAVLGIICAKQDKLPVKTET